jgi:VWFA-related protein
VRVRPRRGPLAASAAVAVVLALAGVIAQQPGPTFKSGVEVVLIDVSVVDRSGQPVGTLAPADFTVTVDRKPRAIASAQFLNYETRTTRVTGTGAAAVPAAPPAAAPPPRSVLIVIDEDSLEPGEGLVARQAAARFLDKLAPNDRVGVVTIPRLRSAVTLSTRRSDARKALDAVVSGVNADLYEFNIGLSEAIDIERGYGDVAQKVVARECRGGDAGCSHRVNAQVRQMQIQAHSRAERSLGALFGLAEGLAYVEGPKTVLLISGGMPMPDVRSTGAFNRVEAAFAAGQVSLYTLYLERSSFGQVKNKPSPTPVEDDLLERDGLENATSVTGGTLMLGVGTLDQYFDRVVTELSGSYLLGVEVAPSDRDGRAHLVNVTVNRAGLEVRARKRYVIEPPRAATPGAATGAPSTKETKPSAAPPPVVVEMMTPEVEAVVAKAGTYATTYESELSGLVAEERYVQRSFKWQRLTVTSTVPAQRGRTTTTTEETGEWVPDAVRELKSDYLLVKAPGGDRWLPFRDVFDVDGKKVREREERLQKLFLEAPATAAERAREIMAESARYNIGFVERNVNLPTLALRFLSPDNRGRALFRKQGEREVAGTRTWELAFSERGSPTVVRDANRDIPAEGAFWIDPAEGRVVRSTMRLKVEGVAIEITVTYRQDARAGRTWVPSEMRETYLGASRKLECVAAYSKVRRFQVTTDDVVR